MDSEALIGAAARAGNGHEPEPVRTRVARGGTERALMRTRTQLALFLAAYVVYNIGRFITSGELVAPPRLAGIGMADSVSEQAAVELTGRSTMLYNELAAVPSLHPAAGRPRSGPATDRRRRMTEHAPGSASRTPGGPGCGPPVGVLPPMARRGRRAYRHPMPIARLSRPFAVNASGVTR
jgi:hypothetical protein